MRTTALPVTLAPDARPEAPPVRYLGSGTGHRVAWAAAGSGRPALLVCPGWLSHLDLDWTSGTRLHAAVAQRRRVLRYDRLGTGLADRTATALTLDAELELIDRLIAAAGETRVAVLGCGLAAPIALAYAARRPSRVSHLVLFGPARGGLCSDAEGANAGELTDALCRLIRADWGLAAGAVAALVLPGADSAVRAEYAEYLRLAASPEVAAQRLAELAALDVDGVVAEIATPTLVIHRRDSRGVALADVRALASRIRGARLSLLDGSEHPITHGDVDPVVGEITGFLEPVACLLTPRELEILGLAAEGLSNRGIAREVMLSEHTVARHLANVFLKLDVGSRSAAAAYARRIGLLSEG